jgi:hypothetical protein
MEPMLAARLPVDFSKRRQLSIHPASATTDFALLDVATEMGPRNPGYL